MQIRTLVYALINAVLLIEVGAQSEQTNSNNTASKPNGTDSSSNYKVYYVIISPGDNGPANTPNNMEDNGGDQEMPESNEEKLAENIVPQGDNSPNANTSPENNIENQNQPTNNQNQILPTAQNPGSCCTCQQQFEPESQDAEAQNTSNGNSGESESPDTQPSNSNNDSNNSANGNSGESESPDTQPSNSNNDSNNSANSQNELLPKNSTTPNSVKPLDVNSHCPCAKKLNNMKMKARSKSPKENDMDNSKERNIKEYKKITRNIPEGAKNKKKMGKSCSSCPKSKKS